MARKRQRHEQSRVRADRAHRRQPSGVARPFPGTAAGAGCDPAGASGAGSACVARPAAGSRAGSEIRGAVVAGADRTASADGNDAGRLATALRDPLRGPAAGARPDRGRRMSTNEHWQSRPEGGGRFALWLIVIIALHGGRRLGRLFLYPITLYFYLRRAPERLASKQYLQRVFGRPATAWQVMKHIHCFAATCLDRIFLLAHGEKSFQIETQGLDLLEQRVAEGRGVLLFGSHQGSFEALRALHTRRPDLLLRVVLDKQKTPAMTSLLEALAPDVGASEIDAAQDGTSIVLAMAETCQAGAVV